MYTLYGMRLSYFTRKLEAAMMWYGQPFHFLPKSMDLQQEIEHRSGTRQVPVLQTPEGWMIADTTPLMDLLDGRYPSRRMFPLGPLGVLVHVVEEWLDEWIPRIAVHYRWQYPDCAAFAAPLLAEDAAPTAPPETRQMLAMGITQWGAKSCRATGMLSERQQREGEAEYERLLEALNAQLSTTRYALGDRPCAVDAVLLGGLRAHFATDPEPRQRTQRYSRVWRWLESRALAWDGTGELAPFPESTPFARHVLGEMKGPYAAFLLANASGLLAGTKGCIAPVYGEEVSFKTRSYPEQSRQMLRARIAQRLGPQEREAVESWLHACVLHRCFGTGEAA